MPKDPSKPQHHPRALKLKVYRPPAQPKSREVLQTKLIIDTSEGSSSANSSSELLLLQNKLGTLEHDTMARCWLKTLQAEFTRSYFQKLKVFLVEEYKTYDVYPPLKDIYSWSNLTPLNTVKVVILGQDPYHNTGQAHGLSFSVLPPTKPPGSLKNIYKQLSLEFQSFIPPKSGDLTPLAKAGVLWLNTSLTVRAHQAASHANKGWEIFTAQIIRAVTERKGDEYKGVVFMAWGLPAQKTCTKVGIDETKNLVLRSAHPSPLSAHRGFIGNGHFGLANTWLEERYGRGSGIDWAILSATGVD